MADKRKKYVINFISSFFNLPKFPSYLYQDPNISILVNTFKEYAIKVVLSEKGQVLVGKITETIKQPHKIFQLFISKPHAGQITSKNMYSDIHMSSTTTDVVRSISSLMKNFYVPMLNNLK